MLIDKIYSQLMKFYNSAGIHFDASDLLASHKPPQLHATKRLTEVYSTDPDFILETLKSGL